MQPCQQVAMQALQWSSQQPTPMLLLALPMLLLLLLVLLLLPLKLSSRRQRGVLSLQCCNLLGCIQQEQDPTAAQAAARTHQTHHLPRTAQQMQCSLLAPQHRSSSSRLWTICRPLQQQQQQEQQEQLAPAGRQLVHHLPQHTLSAVSRLPPLRLLAARQLTPLST
jgi:hypothetical protein